MRCSQTYAPKISLPGISFNDGRNTIETVGGHSENFRMQNGFLIKKTNATEAHFYQRMMRQHVGLSDYMPQCTAVTIHAQKPPHTKQRKECAEVTIEDLRHGFKQPVIVDIKLGTKTVSNKELMSAGSDLTTIVRKDVRLHIADAVSSSSKRGYRFVGSSISQESRMHLGTHPDEMIEKLIAQISTQNLAEIIKQLENLQDYLGTKEGRRFEFIAASVLIIAEADPQLLKNKQAARPKVKLIDFAHSHVVGANDMLLDTNVALTKHRKNVYQHGLISGLTNLISCLKTSAGSSG